MSAWMCRRDAFPGVVVAFGVALRLPVGVGLTALVKGKPPRPRMPRNITVGPHTYDVLTDRASCESHEVASGKTYLIRNLILIHPDQHDSQLRDTLLHELLHACIFQTGVSQGDNPILDAGTEERLVWSLTPILLDMLRRNPKLLPFLLERQS